VDSSNVAEGNGKFTAADKCKFFDIAHGSSVECAACLDLLLVKQLITEIEAEQGKGLLSEIVKMLVALIQSKWPDRFKEEPPPYVSGTGE
jgi:four helix bundle protein